MQFLETYKRAQEINEAYAQGEDIHAIMKRFGISKMTLYRYLKALKTPLRREVKKI